MTTEIVCQIKNMLSVRIVVCYANLESHDLPEIMYVVNNI